MRLEFRQPKDVSKQPKAAKSLPLKPVRGERLVFIGNDLAERVLHFEALMPQQLSG